MRSHSHRRVVGLSEYLGSLRFGKIEGTREHTERRHSTLKLNTEAELPFLFGRRGPAGPLATPHATSSPSPRGAAFRGAALGHGAAQPPPPSLRSSLELPPLIGRASETHNQSIFVEARGSRLAAFDYLCIFEEL